MSQTKEKSKAITIPDARNKITEATIAYCKKHVNFDRKELFKPGVDSLALTKEQLTDTSPGSTYTKYKALIGTIINELVQKGTIKFLSDVPSKPIVSVISPQEIIKQKKEGIKEYLYSKYLTDDEKKDKNPDSKANIIKSLLGIKKNKALIENGTIENIQNEIEEQFKKTAKISEKTEEYPATQIGNCLRNNQEKYNKFIRKQIVFDEYEKSLDNSIFEAINISGGVNFSKISLDLIKAVYGHYDIFDDKVTDGGNDHGIDAEFSIKDELGYIEKFVIQAKTKQNDNASIGEKIVREFIGSMAAAKAAKGIFITNAEIHKDAKEIAKKINNLIFIDKVLLLKLIKKYKVGITYDDNGIARLDRKVFLIE